MRATRPSTIPLRVSTGRLLADLDVLRLRFRDLDFRLEAARVGDAGEVRARRDLLADFDRHDLQHSLEAGADLQLVALLAGELKHGARLIDERLLHGELGAGRFGFARELVFGDLRHSPPGTRRRSATV